MVIQRLLREAERDDVANDLVPVGGDGLEAQADWANLESPETYLGYEQGGADCSLPVGSELRVRS